MASAFRDGDGWFEFAGDSEGEFEPDGCGLTAH
jgi:hypothetical protein